MMFPRQSLLTILIATASAGALCAQAEHPLTGRRIAPPMSISGADWLERGERELEELPEKALDEMGIKPGMVVADVGAGIGYFSVRLAKRVGPTGKVYANDVQPEMLTRLRARLKSEGVNNVVPVLGTESDPKLPAGSCDIILLVDVYHEFTRPQRMLQKMKEALKPNGRLVMLEYRKEDPRLPIRPEHKMSVAEVRKEVEHEGFVLDKLLGVLPRQHVFVFKRNLQ